MSAVSSSKSVVSYTEKEVGLDQARIHLTINLMLLMQWQTQFCQNSDHRLEIVEERITVTTIKVADEEEIAAIVEVTATEEETTITEEVEATIS
jgi:hypothetical protein